MKILVIADVHGREMWKRMVDKEGADQVVFLGDYVDSFDIPWDKQLHNLMDIAEYKRGRGINCTLLVGNHCLPYFRGGDTGVSGYQSLYASHYQSVYEEMFKDQHIQACTTIGDYLFIHAGFTKQWAKNYGIREDKPEDMNDLFYQNMKPFEFQHSPRVDNPNDAPSYRAISSTGDNVWQSPTWVRPMSLKQAAVPGWNQVVGHTRGNKILIEDTTNKDKVYFCDTQDGIGDYLVIIDGVPEVHTL